MIRQMRPLLVRLLRLHLSDAALLALHAEALSRTARRRAIRHLGRCEPCRARLEVLRADLDALTELFEQGAAAPPNARLHWPELLEAMRSAGSGRGLQTASPKALHAYLGRLAEQPDQSLQPGRRPADVLEALLGNRAASALLERRAAARRRSPGGASCT
ncbi:MAG: hypothetical protein ACUVS7_18675 [Bryobacteraceae bacterium]